jgi:glutamate-1-semialdehyde 2,1-aminomutase
MRDLLARERAAHAERTRGSEAMLRRAERSLAAGVASSYHRREPWPVYLESGEGARVRDVDGNEYLDFHNGFSAMAQGHAHPAIAAAVERRVRLGSHFGATTEEAVEVAEELARRFGLPRWRYTNSGTESVMDAIRIARGATGREPVVKIFGSYHGHADTTMVAVGGEPGPWGAGIPEATVAQVHTVQFNDAGGMTRLLAGVRPACVVMEAAMTNAGVVPPAPGYLEAVREATRAEGAVLILDEVKTGLTIAAGGAVERFGVRPDMVALAKALGGGLPTGAVGMTAELAAVVEDGTVHHVGTYNGNPLGMAAARANLLEVLTADAYAELERLGGRMAAGCDEVIARHGLEAHAVGLGSKGCVVHSRDAVVDYPSYERRRDPERAELVWLWLMNRGVLTTPGREQEWNLTVAHDDAAVDRYLEVFDGLAEELARGPS